MAHLGEYYTPVTIAITPATGTGDKTVIAAPGAGRYIVVLNGVVSCSALNVVTIKSGSTVKMGPMSVADDQGFVIPDAPRGAIICGVNEALVFNVSVSDVTGGSLTYVIV